MIYTFLFMIFTAFSSVLRGNLGLKIPIMLAVFLSTLLAVIFFHIINIKNISKTYRKLLKIKSLYLITSFSVLVIWLGSFAIPVYYSPTIQVFSFMLVTSFYGAFFLARKEKDFLSRMRFISIAGLFAVFYGLYFINHSFMSALGMFVATGVTGSFGYIYFIYSSRLSKHHFTASEILMVRFWPLLLISLLFVLKDHQLALVNLQIVNSTVLVSITSLIVPIFCAQKSIDLIGPEFHGVLIGMCPYITFSFEKWVSHRSNEGLGYLAMCLFLAIALPYAIKMVKQKLGQRRLV